jgi:hypothetical protein
MKEGIKAKFSKTKEEALAHIDAANKDDNNVYVALATFKTEKREKNNVQQLKTIFLDIDCGEGKDYPTKTEAYTALKEFTKRYTLPNPSVLVDSGRGWQCRVESRRTSYCGCRSYPTRAGDTQPQD